MHGIPTKQRGVDPERGGLGDSMSFYAETSTDVSIEKPQALGTRPGWKGTLSVALGRAGVQFLPHAATSSGGARNC